MWTLIGATFADPRRPLDLSQPVQELHDRGFLEIDGLCGASGPAGEILFSRPGSAPVSWPSLVATLVSPNANLYSLTPSFSERIGTALRAGGSVLLALTRDQNAWRLAHELAAFGGEAATTPIDYPLHRSASAATTAVSEDLSRAIATVSLPSLRR